MGLYGYTDPADDTPGYNPGGTTTGGPGGNPALKNLMGGVNTNPAGGMINTGGIGGSTETGGDYNLYTSGTVTPGGAHGWDPSQLVFGEDAATRTDNQRNNFYYGGYAGGAQDSIDLARNNVAPYLDSAMGYGTAAAGYGDTLGGYGAGYNDMMGNAQNREAPLSNYYLNSDTYGQSGQYGAANALMDFANGGQPDSAAQAQLNLALNQGMNNQLALARSGRGMGESAAGLAMAGRNQAQLAGTAQQQAAALAAQEQQAWLTQQQNALAQAGGLYGQGRAADMAAAGYYTGSIQNQTGLNDNFALGLGGLSNDALNNAGNLQLGAGQNALGAAHEQLGVEGLSNQINTAALLSNNAYEQNLTDIYGINKGIPSGGGGGMNWGGLIGGLGGGALGFMAGGPAGAGAGAAGGYEIGTGVSGYGR